MASIKKLLLWITVSVIFTLIATKAVSVISWMKFGRVVFSHQPGPCQLIKGLDNGSEDMESLPNGIVLISAGLRIGKTLAEWKDTRGHIMLYDVSSPQKAAVPLNIKGNIDLELFNPHGLSIWQEKGEVRLFVINHLPDKEVVEVFTFDVKKPTELQHVETILLADIALPNDLVAVGPRQFYVTNTFRFKDGLVGEVERMCKLRLSSVLYYDGEATAVVVDGMSIANGINQSPDGKLIYVAFMGDDEVRVYERNRDNSLDVKQIVNVGPADNIDVDAGTGDLWVGVHPVPHLVLSHLADPSLVTPSQILHLKTSGGLVKDIVEVYSEDGSKLISGASVGVHYKNKLVVGSIAHRAVLCDILHPQ